MKDSSFQFISRAKIVSGSRALECIPLELAGYNRKRPFVLTGPGEAARNSTRRFFNALADSGMTIPAFWDGVVSGDDITLGRELASVFKTRNCDSLIAIGGGNTLKMTQVMNQLIYGNDDKSPLFLVPTAVICDTDLCISGQGNEDISAVPDVIFIDSSIKTPVFNDGYVNASMGSFSRAADGFFGTANPLSDSFRHSAVSLLYGNVPRFLKNPGNAGARTAVINGIIHGGIALGNSEPGIVHELGGAIADKTGAVRGVVMCMLLQPVIEYRINEGQNTDALLRSLTGINKYCSIKPKDRAKETILCLNNFITTALNSIPAPMRDIHLSDNDLKDALACSAESTGISEKKLSEIAAGARIHKHQGGKR